MNIARDVNNALYTCQVLLQEKCYPFV